MSDTQVDPVEMQAAISGLEKALADLPETGSVVMTAGEARFLLDAALRQIPRQGAFLLPAVLAAQLYAIAARVLLERARAAEQSKPGKRAKASGVKR
jgi:hypothetical protein